MANAWRITSQLIGMSPIGSVDTTATAPLGTIVTAVHETYGVGEFIYLKGVASTVVGSAVLYNPDDWTTSLLAANDIGSVGVAMAATVVNTFGWYQVKGKAIVKAGTVADNANVYSTATAGTLDDAVVAGDRLKNAKFASADGTPSAGLAELEIDRPFVDDAVAA